MRMIHLKNNVLLFILALCMGCTNNGLNPKDYKAYFNNKKNGLISSIQTDSFEYSLQYRNGKLLALIEAGENANSATISELISKYDNTEFYLLKIRKKFEGPLRLNDFSNYMAFDFQKEIKRIAKDTSDCMLYNFEATAGIGPDMQCMFAFKSLADNQINREILIKKFACDTLVSFQFASTAISNIPKLKI